MEGDGWGREKEGTLARKPLDFEKRPLVFTVEFIYWLTTGRWKTRGRGPGVRGPRVQGPGVWKTRGLVENAGSNVENTGNHHFSPKYALSSLKWQGKILLAKLRWISIQQLGLKRVSRSKKNKFNISWERKPLKCQSLVHWFSFGAVFCFSQ